MLEETQTEVVRESEASLFVEPRFAEWQDAPIVKIPWTMRWRTIIRSQGFLIALLSAAYWLLRVSSIGAKYLHWNLFIRFMPLLLAIAIKVVIWARLRRREASWQVARLLDIPPPANQFPVSATYQTDDFAFGRADGVLTFAEGWMNFASPSVSWSVRAADVSSISHLNNAPVLTIETTSDTRHFETTLHLFSSALIDQQRVNFSSEEFSSAVQLWRSCSAEGTPFLPPNTPPAEKDRNRGRRKFVLGFASVAVLLGIVGVVHPAFWEPILGVISGLALVGIVILRGNTKSKADLVRAGKSPNAAKSWLDRDLNDLFRR